MSEVEKAIGKYLCGELVFGRKCEKHERQAHELTVVVAGALIKDREAEAQRALDRIVDEVVKRGTHAV